MDQIALGVGEGEAFPGRGRHGVVESSYPERVADAELVEEGPEFLTALSIAV